MGFAGRTVLLSSIAALTLTGVDSARAVEPVGTSAGPPTAAAGAGEIYAAARAAFKAAYARASAGEIDSTRDTALLKHYPLYPYLEAARIRQALDGSPELLPRADDRLGHAANGRFDRANEPREGADDRLAPVDERAAEFITAHSHQPVARGLRRAWLESLARRARWGEFLEVYRDAEASDALRCRSYAARIALGRINGLARDIETTWLTPASLPECEQAFAWLKESGLLTPELIEQRARLALAAGNTAFAREMADQLPPDRAAPLLQWVSLLEFPETSIDTLLSSAEAPVGSAPGRSAAVASAAVDPAALLAGWSRLARKDPLAAEARFATLVRARGLTAERASPYARALALGLAWDRDPGALDYFDRVLPSDLDDDADEWRARAALWSGNWQLALRAIAALSPSERQTARWRYWSARIAEQLHEDEQARQLYESILSDDDYYSAMAAVRLRRPVAPHPQPLPLDRRVVASLGRMPALVRARELFFCGMRPEADIEWRAAVESLSAPERLQAIQLATGWGWYDKAVATATALHVFNDYTALYPRPFDEAVRTAARRTGLAPDIIYGVIRQESLYRADAVSSAGARGLMQLQLATARRTARASKHPRPSPDDLFDPAINIPLGAERLKMLLDRFEGQLPVALAGYNAGSHAAARWLPAQPMEPDIWIENIPYNETREYVERVLWHSVLYAWLRAGGEPQRVDSWLAPITPLRQVASAP